MIWKITTLIGISIGNTYAGCPTCADDIVLLSLNNNEMQEMLDIVLDYAGDHKFQIHPVKSNDIIKTVGGDSRTNHVSISGRTNGGKLICHPDSLSRRHEKPGKQHSASNWFNPATFLCLLQTKTWISIFHGLFVINDLG